VHNYARKTCSGCFLNLTFRTFGGLGSSFDFATGIFDFGISVFDLGTGAETAFSCSFGIVCGILLDKRRDSGDLGFGLFKEILIESSDGLVDGLRGTRNCSSGCRSGWSTTFFNISDSSSMLDRFGILFGTFTTVVCILGRVIGVPLEPCLGSSRSCFDVVKQLKWDGESAVKRLS
jgi:hypothetical protein